MATHFIGWQAFYGSERLYSPSTRLFYFIVFICIIFDCGKIFQDGHNPMFKIIKRSDSEMNY